MKRKIMGYVSLAVGALLGIIFFSVRGSFLRPFTEEELNKTGAAESEHAKQYFIPKSPVIIRGQKAGRRAVYHKEPLITREMLEQEVENARTLAQLQQKAEQAHDIALGQRRLAVKIKQDIDAATEKFIEKFEATENTQKPETLASMEKIYREQLGRAQEAFNNWLKAENEVDKERLKQSTKTSGESEPELAR